MTRQQAKAFKNLQGKLNNTNEGFVLPLVMIVGLIMTVGGFALIARSFGGLIGSQRLEQARQARAIAESGIAQTIESLNSDYRYLLINCYTRNGSIPGSHSCVEVEDAEPVSYECTWGNPCIPSSICPDATSSGTPDTTGITTNPSGDYEVDYYAYTGTQYYGGTGTLRVIGHRKSSDNTRILASAVVETSFDIKPKPCDNSYGSPATNSGFPGLLASFVTMGGNDVIGKTSGNILCTKCTTPTYTDTNADGIIDSDERTKQNEPVINCNTQCDVGGEIFIGDIDIPPVPEYPSHLEGNTEYSDIDLQSGNITIAAGSANGVNNDNRCETEEVDDTYVTHCKVSNIIGYGKRVLNVDTSNGPVNLYIQGDVKLSGKSGIIHHGSAKDLSLFGLPTSSQNACSTDDSFVLQDIKISGGASGSNMFIFFPCGDVGINGGSKNNCDIATDDNCAGGDIRGAVWSKSWTGSSGNQAQLVVPRDLPSELVRRHGTSFATSIQDYISLGVNSWFSFERES